MSPLLLLLLLAVCLHLEVVLSFNTQSRDTSSLDWALVTPVRTHVSSAGDCEVHCFLDTHCEHWTYLSTNQSCFLTSKYLNFHASSPLRDEKESSALTTAPPSSAHTSIVQGHKKQYMKHVNRLFHGPLATSKSSYVNFPQSFYEGCSYTISFWVWMYETESVIDKKLNKPKELAIFSTRLSLPIFDKYEPLLPAIVFNVGSHKEKLFFSSKKDSFSEYEGAWGDNVVYNQWTHITIVFKPTSFAPYINGKSVRQEVLMSPKGTCPFWELIDMSARSASEIEIILEDFAYANETDPRHNDLPTNTILDVSSSKSSAPLFGVYEEMDIFSGIELSSHQVKLLYESSRARVEGSLPTLEKLVSNFKSRGGGGKGLQVEDVLENEYAMVALYGRLPAGRVYGGVVCVDGVDKKPKSVEEVEVEIEIETDTKVAEAEHFIILNSKDPLTSSLKNAKPTEVFILNFAIGTKTFPYKYLQDVDAMNNAAAFCKTYWSPLSEAFEEAAMPGIDQQTCANIVAEVTATQVEHALQFGQQSRSPMSLATEAVSSISEAFPAAAAAETKTEMVVEAISEFVEESSSGFDSDTSMRVSEGRDQVIGAIAGDEVEELLPLSSRVDSHLRALGNLLRAGSSDPGSASPGTSEGNGVSDLHWEEQVEKEIRSIEALLAESAERSEDREEYSTLVERVQAEFLAMDGLTNAGAGIGGGTGRNGVTLSGSARKFQQLLVHIESVLYSPLLDDNSFYDELDATVLALREAYYATEELLNKEDDSEANKVFEMHLHDLYNSFASDSDMYQDVSESHLDAFEDAIDALYGDILAREEGFQHQHQKDHEEEEEDGNISVLSSSKPTASVSTTVVGDDDVRENILAAPRERHHISNTALSTTTTTTTVTESIGNLDGNFDIYNNQIAEIARLNISSSNTSNSSSFIEINRMNVLPKKSKTKKKTETRMALEKQLFSLELKLGLENYLRDPFHREETADKVLQQNLGEVKLSSSERNSSTSSGASADGGLGTGDVYFVSALWTAVTHAGRAVYTTGPSGLLELAKNTTLSVLSDAWSRARPYLSPLSLSIFHDSKSASGNDDMLKPSDQDEAILYVPNISASDAIFELVTRGLQSEKVLDFLDNYPDDESATEALVSLNASLTSALETIYQSVQQTTHAENAPNISQALGFIQLDTLIDGLLFQQDLIEKEKLEDEYDIFDDAKIAESMRLYDAAMQWVDGKNVLFSRYGERDQSITIGTDIGVLTSRSHNHSESSKVSKSTAYDEDAAWEASESSLIFSMWLADELEIEHPLLASGGGMFQGCGMLGQPSRMALGYRRSVPQPNALPLQREDRVQQLLAMNMAPTLASPPATATNAVSLDGHYSASGVKSRERPTKNTSHVLNVDALDILVTLEALLDVDIIDREEAEGGGFIAGHVLTGSDFSAAPSTVTITITMQADSGGDTGIDASTDDRERAVFSLLSNLSLLDRDLVTNALPFTHVSTDAETDTVKKIESLGLRDLLTHTVVAAVTDVGGEPMSPAVSFSSDHHGGAGVSSLLSSELYTQSNVQKAKEEKETEKEEKEQNRKNNEKEEEEARCQVSAAYYFPVMQFVSSNYGIPESGVKHPEVFRLSDLGPIGGGVSGALMSLGGTISEWLGVDVPGPMGVPAANVNGAGSGGGGGGGGLEGWEGSSITAYYEGEAAEGNADALVWLGVRYFWGSNGYPSNTTLARHYFELAAKQNNGEALYCLGAMHENGQGGLVRNVTKAMQLFTRAANLPNPHPAALQVLGSHYHRGPAKQKNLTLAKYYYEKSAELGDSNGFYCLGNLYREGYGAKQSPSRSTNSTSGAVQPVTIEPNIPLSLHFLAIAASRDHPRALSTLAHAFSDSDSWLGHYHRAQQQQIFRNSSPAANSSGVSSSSNSSHSSATTLSTESVTATDSTTTASNSVTFISTTAEKDNKVTNEEAKKKTEEEREVAELLFTRWGFNESKPVSLRLKNDLTITFPLPYQPSCAIALPLLKHLSEFSYRPNDLSVQALEQFLVQDYVGALKLFDEAAELGVELAQLNSAFLYKYFLSTPVVLPVVCAQMIASVDNRQHCKLHFEKMLDRRLIQLAHLGNPEGFRELGDKLMLMSAGADDASKTGITEPVVAIAGTLLASDDSMQQTLLAGKMYAHGALKYKDITSLMSLASMIYTGSMTGIPKNSTLAKELYYTALEWEREGSAGMAHTNADTSTTKTDESNGESEAEGLSRSLRTGKKLPRKVYTYNDLGVTTGGIAPTVALLGIYAEEAIEYVKDMLHFRA